MDIHLKHNKRQTEHQDAARWHVTLWAINQIEKVTLNSKIKEIVTLRICYGQIGYISLLYKRVS